MAKTIRKIFTMILAICVCAGMIIPQALAAEITTESTTESTTEGGITTTVTTTTETIVDGGTTTIVVTVDASKEGTDENDVTVSGEETTTTTTTTEANGTVTEVVVTDGSETKEWTEDDLGNTPNQPKVEVELVPGETTTGTATETVVEGELDSEEGQTTTTTTDRTVEATTSKSEIIVESTGTGEFSPIQTDRDMIYVEENQLHTHSKTSYKQTSNPTTAMANKPEDEQYDFLFIGQGQMSDFYVGVDNPNGDGTYSDAHSGALQFELLYDPTVENGQYVNDGENLFTTYCVDLTTGAIAGYWYKMDNLEDAGYYDEEAAAHIRSIVTTGYWGTNPGDDAENPSTGSLEKLKITMKEDGNTGLTDEEIDQITPGQALAATQAAIWSYANATTDGGIVDEERLIITGYKAPTVPTEDDFNKAMAVYTYLRNLTPTDESESTEIIDKDSFIHEDSMSITVGDKDADNAANADDDQDNDVYNVDVNFAMVVTPTDDDNLIVQVLKIDADGNTVVAAQGRIAGDNSSDEGFNEVIYDAETGTYTLKNLKLAETSEFSFDLKLVGSQYLQEGVYIFNSEVRDGVDSQTFVGLVEGHKEVNVKQNFVINFTVDETNYVVSEREWHSEYDPVTTPPATPPTVPTTPPEEILIPDEDVPEDVMELDGDVIIDEEVPLADVPSTGDASVLWLLLSAAVIIGLVLVNLSNKKRIDA